MMLMPKMTEEEKNQDSKLMGRKRMQRRLASPLGIFITDNKMKYFEIPGPKYTDHSSIMNKVKDLQILCFSNNFHYCFQHCK